MYPIIYLDFIFFVQMFKDKDHCIILIDKDKWLFQFALFIGYFCCKIYNGEQQFY